MHDDTDVPPLSPWGWVRTWLREERFWRDIGARVLAGVLTAAIVYAGAVLLGYLHTPEIGAGLLLALGIFACGSLLVGSAALLRHARRRAVAGESGAGSIVAAVLLVCAVVAIAIGVVSDLLRP
ncbi:hypothetical protein FHS07_001805 [Microbacterium proteolyticum]|uniref:Uncharacterized protein n=1 Tax=Microbacterium proteolyticum TaxID=1572644 RepID=A0A7W5GF18_9MICO|nr:hypothetical protein [Microbacterium proteolyticum]MBB3158109.1 hypothetical protein [Microbacterium proteolyticum]